jgi:hypothetical protein
MFCPLNISEEEKDLVGKFWGERGPLAPFLECLKGYSLGGPESG